MRKTLALLLLASAAGACGHTPSDQPERGVSALNVPVVARTDYAFDAAAPGGMLAPGEAGRLDAWFRGLELGYGDAIFVDGPYADAVRGEVAQVAGQYGLMVSRGAPVTVGAMLDGTVRVVVSRNRASVPGCPNWSEPASPNYQNRIMSNFGCSVNGNLAAMIANPSDLVHGQEGGAVVDPATSAKAVNAYRNKPATSGGVQAVSTK
ncbi:CpaD family pilus assembly lipoprotein [uncultured Sphingomonas sp.]|uniref:CpaD family pilus assembly protein n=1 Tax=uncultured Sphingomonas sp. TaxID=158754 RepID=UPI0025EABFC2|nr:CpaD family pilus assembly lipoprotein [uncultured Sphingomonas sp.]